MGIVRRNSLAILRFVQEKALDDLDMRLIHALQIRARIPWTALAKVLAVDAITLTRRWQRLQERGLVYTAAMPRQATQQYALAIVEITCNPASTGLVGKQLVADPAIVSIDVPSFGSSFLVTLSGVSTDAIMRWVSQRSEDTNITAIQTHLVSELVGDASQWRPRVLNADQITAIQSHERPPKRPVTLSDAEIRELYEELGKDVRAPIGELARRIGVPERRLSDSLAGLLASNEILFRIDVARTVTPTPVYVWYFIRIAAKDLRPVANQLRQLPNMRSVIKTVGKFNLQTGFWLRDLSEIHMMEEMLESQLPPVTAMEPLVITRTLKHIGRPIDESGLAAGRIRMEPCR